LNSLLHLIAAAGCFTFYLPSSLEYKNMLNHPDARQPRSLGHSFSAIAQGFAAAAHEKK
jgi:hypothetical protein